MECNIYLYIRYCINNCFEEYRRNVKTKLGNFNFDIYNTASTLAAARTLGDLKRIPNV